MKTTTIEYIGPHRPPWGTKCPLKIVSYFDDASGTNKTAKLQFIIKNNLCICEDAPADAAYKIISSSQAFIKLEDGTKFSEKRIIGLKVTKVNKSEKLEEKLAETEKALKEEREKTALAQQKAALEREAEARDNASSSAPAEDAKAVEKEELGVPK